MSVPLSTTPANQELNVGVFTFGDIPGMTDFTWNAANAIAGFNFVLCSSLLTLNFPNLLGVDAPSPFITQQNGFFQIDVCNNLTSLSTPLIQKVGGNIVVANCAALTAVSFPALTSINGTQGLSPFGLAVGNLAACTSVSFPVLTHCGGQFECDQLPVGCTINFPVLVDIQGDMIMTSTLITTEVFPDLTTVTGNIVGGFSPNLVTVSFPVLLPTPGKTIAFNSCPSLSASTVNGILARCVANAGFTTGNVILDGAAPTGQGITDKATLIGRGVSVTTN